jgi:hypothetical protein
MFTVHGQTLVASSSTAPPFAPQAERVPVTWNDACNGSRPGVTGLGAIRNTDLTDDLGEFRIAAPEPRQHRRLVSRVF